MKEIFNLLINHKLSPNQFYLLISMKEGISPPLINIYTELRGLKANDWVTSDNKLTQKAYLIINDIETQIKLVKKKSMVSIIGKESDEYITKYLDMWPKGILPSGKPARSPKNIIASNFIWFFQNHKYSWDTILKATAYYLDEYEKKTPSYMYMKTSVYFISKADQSKVRESELANYCEIIESGDDINTNSNFTSKVV